MHDKIPTLRPKVCTRVDSKKLEHGCRMMCVGLPSFFGSGLPDGHVPTFWLSLCGNLLRPLIKNMFVGSL